MKAMSTLNKKFASLSLREKWLIMVGGLVGLFFIMLTLVIDPVVRLTGIQNKQVSSETSQIKRMKSEISNLIELAKKNPDAEIDKELSSLSGESQALSMKLSEFVSNLIAPSEMPELLEAVLDSSTSLKLESLQSLPAEPIVINGQEDTSYYLHPVRIELTGRYFDIKSYLSRLEEMKARYFWRHFSYEVAEYPKARLVLVVYTLGTRQEFIGG